MNVDIKTTVAFEVPAHWPSAAKADITHVVEFLRRGAFDIGDDEEIINIPDNLKYLEPVVRESTSESNGTYSDIASMKLHAPKGNEGKLLGEVNGDAAAACIGTVESLLTYVAVRYEIQATKPAKLSYATCGGGCIPCGDTCLIWQAGSSWTRELADASPVLAVSALRMLSVWMMFRGQTVCNKSRSVYAFPEGCHAAYVIAGPLLRNGEVLRGAYIRGSEQDRMDIKATLRAIKTNATNLPDGDVKNDILRMVTAGIAL